MNQLNTLLSAKMDDLFGTNVPNTTVHENTCTPVQKQIKELPVPIVSKVQYESLCNMIHIMKQQLDEMLHVLNGKQNAIISNRNTDVLILAGGERIIEGVFTGEHMVGADGQTYHIPANYASKSKLVEGDLMKVTITQNGKLIFKQISQTTRKILSGELTCDEHGQWTVVIQDRPYRVLTASITFHRGKSGDQVTIIVPKDEQSGWGAVEHIFSV